MRINYVQLGDKIDRLAYQFVQLGYKIYGEKACAFVILKPGETLDFAELIQFLMEKKIAKFKLPERLEVVDQFPISPVGKILKRALCEKIAEKIAQEI